MKPRGIQSIIDSEQAGFPEEHSDELGPYTHRELVEQRNDELDEIYSRLVNDTDAVKKEGRFSNNVSSLRPNMNSDYFGNTDTDERSALMPKNETNRTRVRNTMAPTTASA